MKAIIARDFAPLDQLVYADWPEPQAIGRTVVIEAEAIGVNYPDGLLVQGLYQMRPPTPVRAGHGGRRPRRRGRARRDRASEPGDRVAAFSTHGSYAEKVGADEASVMKLPDALSVEDACALICGYGTSHYALKQRAKLKPGETLAVLGASGATGIAAIQIGKLMGANVIGVASTEEKRAIATAGGRRYRRSAMTISGIASRKRAAATASTSASIRSAAMRSTGWRGRWHGAAGCWSSALPPAPSRNSRSIWRWSKASAWSASSGAPSSRSEPKAFADNMRELFGWRLAGKVAPVIEGIYPLADAAAVLKRVHSRGSAGKLILRP